jgi:hypothetical protein
MLVVYQLFFWLLYKKFNSDTERNRRARRWVEAGDGNTDRVPDIPVEWEC